MTITGSCWILVHEYSRVIILNTIELSMEFGV